MKQPVNKPICVIICICLLTAVLCVVSMVYLAVAVYVPSYHTLNSGFSEETVRCTTVSSQILQNCKDEEGFPSWSSCGEWCMSKASGPSLQVRANVRRNGSNIRLKECQALDTYDCQGMDPEEFECSNGVCDSSHEISNSTREQCNDINIYERNMIIRQGDIIHAAKCARARDIEKDIEIWPRNLQSIKYPDRTQMLCFA